MAHWIAAATGVLLGSNLMILSASPLPASPRDSEESLLRRIERQGNPVKRAKLEIRLGRLHLEGAMEAFERGELNAVYSRLDQYLETMQGAWTTLQNSGREAWRKPQGFKDLDIALREDDRALQDFLRRVPYDYRGPIEEVTQKAQALRGEVLKALFPQEDARKKKSRAGPLGSRAAKVQWT